MFSYHLSYVICLPLHVCIFFFFNDTATTEIYTLSLHDALPIFEGVVDRYPNPRPRANVRMRFSDMPRVLGDRKSTLLNSSHLVISYAVFCLKKKKIAHSHIYPL